MMARVARGFAYFSTLLESFQPPRAFRTSGWIPPSFREEPRQSRVRGGTEASHSDRTAKQTPRPNLREGLGAGREESRKFRGFAASSLRDVEPETAVMQVSHP